MRLLFALVASAAAAQPCSPHVMVHAERACGGECGSACDAGVVDALAIDVQRCGRQVFGRVEATLSPETVECICGRASAWADVPRVAALTDELCADASATEADDDTYDESEEHLGESTEFVFLLLASMLTTLTFARLIKKRRSAFFEAPPPRQRRTVLTLPTPTAAKRDQLKEPLIQDAEADEPCDVKLAGF